MIGVQLALLGSLGRALASLPVVAFVTFGVVGAVADMAYENPVFDDYAVPGTTISSNTTTTATPAAAAHAEPDANGLGTPLAGNSDRAPCRLPCH